MIGTPKHLNTRYDWLLFISEFPETNWRPRLERLYDDRMGWLTTGKLAEAETGVTDDTHRVVEIKDESGVVVERYQDQYMLDPNCALLRADLTVAEIEEWLGIS
jgi:hypothetical protein